MIVAVSIVGIVLATGGGLLLYFYSGPTASKHVLLDEGFDEQRQTRWSRIGLALTLLGAGLQALAVVLATTAASC